MFFICLGQHLTAATVYVAPDGKDVWSGSLARANADGTNGPKASLDGAREAVRGLLAKKGLQPIEVVIADGEYVLAAPVVFEPKDSGSDRRTVTYRAAEGARPLFTAGLRLSGFTVDGDLWRLQVPQVDGATFRFEQLYIDGRRATRARTPNGLKTFRLGSVSEEVIEATTKKRGVHPKARQTVTMPPDIIAPLASLMPPQQREVVMVLFAKWDNTRRYVDDIDATQRAVRTSGRGMKPWNPWDKNTFCYVENYRGALDAAGEWFLSDEGVLYYKPLPGQDPSQVVAYAARTPQVLEFAGDGEGQKFVSHLTFRGLRFHHSAYKEPRSGFEASQAASPIPAAIMIDGGRHIHFADCEIAHTGTYGIWFRRACRDCSVRRTVLRDLGAGGVRIGETRGQVSEANRTGGIVVDNNIIHAAGRIFPCAVGVLVGQSGDNVITHNDIGDLYYTGISLGWCWGYKPTLATGNQVRFNHIHHIGQGLLSDMGGIYTLGPSKGTVISDNVIHDISSHHYGGWGLYTDEGSSDIIMERNLVYNTKTGGFHQHYGKENIIRNNIFAFSSEHQLQATKAERHLSFTFTRNIVYFDSGRKGGGESLFHRNWSRVKISAHKNCYFDAGVKKKVDPAKVKVKEEGSIVADPLFADPDKYDFTVQEGSPVHALGFEPLTPDKAGVYGDEEWVNYARSLPLPGG